MNLDRFVQPLEGRQLMSSTLPITPAPTLISEPVHEYADISAKVRIGYLPHLVVGHVSQLHAEISWGDGTASPASFERDKNGGIDVLGTHTYAKTGVFSIGSSVTETPYPTGTGVLPQFILELGAIKTTATVAPTPPTLIEVAGQKFTAELGKFHYFTVDIIFTTLIHWGDGHTTPGVLTGGDLNKGNWTVSGTHTYPHTGVYTVHADVYSQVAGSHMKPTLFADFVTLVHVMGRA